MSSDPPSAATSRDDTASSPDSQLGPESQRNGAPFQGPLLVVLASAAILLGRGLAPALPGSRSGIEAWIMRLETGSRSLPALGAWLTQLTLLLGGWLCIHIVLRMMGDRKLTLPLRAIITLFGSLLFALVALANVAYRPLDEAMLVGLAVCAAALGVVAARHSLAHPGTRAAGIVILLMTVAGVLHVAARMIALHASSKARSYDFWVARGCASVAFVVSVAAAVFALYWLLRKRSPRGVGFTLAALLPVPLLVWAASCASREGARYFQVLAARSLNELRTQPEPLILAPLRDAAELFAFAVGLLVLGRPNTAAPLRAAVGLALISRANLDIPLYALALACAALLALSFGRDLRGGLPPVDRVESEHSARKSARFAT